MNMSHTEIRGGNALKASKLSQLSVANIESTNLHPSNSVDCIDRILVSREIRSSAIINCHVEDKWKKNEC